MKDLRRELEARHKQQLYRKRLINDKPQGPETIINGRRVISFCSNDYLGLANHPDVNRAFQQGIKRWGSGSGAAHLINGHSTAHHALEEELADFTGRQQALLFSTGYMANLGVATALLERNERVFEDRLNHASLLDAGLLSGAKFSRYRHADASDLNKKMQSDDDRFSLVMTDGVFSMDGDIAPLAELAKTCGKYNSCLMVDDAHGLGVIPFQGKQAGQGTTAKYELGSEQVPVLMGTLGKAFGTFGAFVAGDQALIETLIQKARTYIYTTALPAAVAEATRASLNIIRSDNSAREHLQHLITQFKQQANQLGLPLMPSETPIQPLLVGDSAKALALSQALLQEGIHVTAIRPPTVPADTARLRITLSAAHTETQLKQLLSALEKHFT